MNRNEQQRNKRIRFSQLAVKDNKAAAKKLRSMAKGLENTRTFADTLAALSEIFGVSEKTILRDLQNDRV